jgi:putative ABC transport system ATP-binding protein
MAASASAMPGPSHTDGDAILLEGLGRRYQVPSGEVTALRDIDLHVAANSSMALMGASGSGKTTLLNLIAGLDRPTEGTVTVLGQRLDRMPDRELTAFRAHHVGLVFQDPNLLPGLTAVENLVAARLPWESGDRLEKRARTLLGEVGLRDRQNFPPARLSGGERQRVGIARALLGNPALLLADEPTGNLDERSTEELLDLLQSIQKSTGLTMVLATHDPRVADRADIICRLHDGALAQPDPG